MQSFKLGGLNPFLANLVENFSLNASFHQTAVSYSWSQSEVKDLDEFKEKMNAMERGLSFFKQDLLKNDSIGFSQHGSKQLTQLKSQKLAAIEIDTTLKIYESIVRTFHIFSGTRFSTMISAAERFYITLHDVMIFMNLTWPYPSLQDFRVTLHL